MAFAGPISLLINSMYIFLTKSVFMIARNNLMKSFNIGQFEIFLTTKSSCNIDDNKHMSCVLFFCVILI
jgi:hypothetical protein